MTSPPGLKWSDTFRLMDAADAQSRELTGDKIILPHSALTQLLQAAEAANSSALRSTSDYSYSRPPDLQQLPHPLMFRLMNPNTNKSVFAGVREFSATEGCIGLSPYLLTALGIVVYSSDSTSDVTRNLSDSTETQGIDTLTAIGGLKVTVHAEQAPKGTLVRLRSLVTNSDRDDWKPLLEHHLRTGYTTLTKNTVLSFHTGLRPYSFIIEHLEPEGYDGVCVVDTDLSVDMVPMDSDDDMPSVPASPAQTDTSGNNGGNIDIWKPVSGLVAPGSYVNYELPSWDRSQALEIRVSDLADDISVDLLVSPFSFRHRTKPEISNYMFGVFEPTSPGTKTIIIPPSNTDVKNAEILMISLYGYLGHGTPKGPSSFTLRARVVSTSTEDSAIEENGQEHNPDEDQCPSCQKWVSKSTMMLHENFCHRQNVVCPKCHDVFLKSSDEWANHWHCEHDSSFGSSAASKVKHDSIFHRLHICESCKAEFDSRPKLAYHSSVRCPNKLILCRFCHLVVQQGGDPNNLAPELLVSGLTAHEYLDGSRTTECYLCDKIVRMRDLETHQKNHDLDKAKRSTPFICRNTLCGRTRFGVGARGVVHSFADVGMVDRLGLCAICFEPLFATTHDPDGKAMQRRVERRYLKQLMGGCGKATCRNDWCKTGRKNTGLGERGVKAAEALSLVKPLLATIRQENTPTYFCVEQLNARKRVMAEGIAGEGVFALEWCIAAVEAASSGLQDDVRDWLDDWAPRKV